MTLGNIYTSEAPLPRSFECAKCCAKTLRFRSESAAIDAWNRRADEEEGL